MSVMGQVSSSLRRHSRHPEIVYIYCTQNEKIVHAKFKKNLRTPTCGEPIEMIVDLSEAQQEYIEDCFVCCHQIVRHQNLLGNYLLTLRNTSPIRLF